MVITLGSPEFGIMFGGAIVLQMWIYRDTIKYKAMDEWAPVAEQLMVLINYKLNFSGD